MDREVFLKRLEALMAKRGHTMHSLSLAIEANGGYIRDIVNSKTGTMPGGTKLAAIARELLTTVDYLSGQSDNEEQVVSDVVLEERAVPYMPEPRQEEGIPLVGTGDCADIEVASETGEMVSIDRSSFDPMHTVRYISRPPALRGARDLYAIYFQGESMQPRFEPGEVGIVDPTRPAKPGDYVIVQLNDAASETDVSSVLAKRLVRKTAKAVTLEQFNPAMAFDVPVNRVVRVHRIMPQTDLLFG
ncbi:MAG: S24 family peptidase [Pseudomonadota bacterium]